jgi:hypothetical protein
MSESNTRFGAIDDGFSRTVSNLEKRLDGFAQSVGNVSAQTSVLPKAIAALGARLVAIAGSVAAAAVGIKTFAKALDFQDKLDNLKAQTGASRQSLIRLQRAFDLTGTSADKVAPAINKVQEVIAKAGEGSPKAVEQLAALKLSFDELKNLSPAQQLEAVFEAIGSIPGPAQRAEEAMAFFSTRLGRELLPLIRDFDGAMAKSNATLGSFPDIVEKYGPAMSRFKGAVDALKQMPTAFAYSVVAPMSNLLGALAQRFSTFDIAAFGERIGITLNNALVQMLIWAENVTFLLGGIWEGLGALNLGPTLQGALNHIATFVELAKRLVGTIYTNLRDADYAEIGRRIGAAIAYGLEPLKELDTNPAAALTNFYARLDEQTIQFGANLSKVVAESLSQGVAMSRAFEDFLDSEQVKGIGERIANGIYFAILNFPKWNEAMSSPVNAFKMMWGASQESNTNVLKDALIRAFELANSRYVDLFTQPAKLAAGLFGQWLTDAFLGFLKTFADAWSNTNGTIIEKFRAAYDAVTESTGKKMVGASETASNNTKQAGEHLASGAQQLKDGSAEAAKNIKDAKMDVTGSGGIAPALDANANALNQTADKTQTASGQITTAFDNVAKSGTATGKSVQDAGSSFNKQAVDAGRTFASDVSKAMRGLTDSMRGFATESTLRAVLGEMQHLSRRLPQPVLV